MCSSDLYASLGEETTPLGDKVAKAYGISTPSLLDTGPYPEDLLGPLLDPWTALATHPYATATTDAEGRLESVSLDGETALRIVSYSAPKAVAPDPRRFVSESQVGQLGLLASEGDSLQIDMAAVLRSAAIDRKSTRLNSSHT